MLAGALCRLAADAPRTSPHDMPHLARTLRRALLARNTAQGPHARALSRAFAAALYARRSYATTARATKPTATVKKAVKTATAKKPAPKKAASAKKAAAPKKKAAPKTAARRTAKKPAAKKKPAPKKRVKKVLTPEEKQKIKISDLRKKALKEPNTPNAVTAYNAFIAEVSTGNGQGSSQKLSDAAKAFKNLTPAEIEHYNHLANEKTKAKRAAYEAFIQSYTPEEIKIANNARIQLRKLLAGSQKKRPANTRKLDDDRIPKRVGPYPLFVRARYASGDFHNIKPQECLKLISAEWKALSAAEKKKYQDEAAAQIAATNI